LQGEEKLKEGVRRQAAGGREGEGRKSSIVNRESKDQNQILRSAQNDRNLPLFSGSRFTIHGPSHHRGHRQGPGVSAGEVRERGNHSSGEPKSPCLPIYDLRFTIDGFSDSRL